MHATNARLAVSITVQHDLSTRGTTGVALAVIDHDSGHTIIQVTFTPEEFVKLIGQGMYTVVDGWVIPEAYRARIGRVVVSMDVALEVPRFGSGAPEEAYVLSDEMVGKGWDEAEPYNSSGGWWVVCRSYVRPEEVEAFKARMGIS